MDEEEVPDVVAALVAGRRDEAEAAGVVEADVEWGRGAALGERAFRPLRTSGSPSLPLGAQAARLRPPRRFSALSVA